MSRIGKTPVAIPQGVDVKIADGEITVKGKLGQLTQKFDSAVVSVKSENGHVVFECKSEEQFAGALHGTLRANLANMVKGVSEGFERKLEIRGVGYRASVQGDVVNLALGYSHPIAYKLPKSCSAAVDQNFLTLKSYDKQALGQAAADIRGFRPPENYKGKGVRYAEEHVEIKVVKKKK